ncbi:hypothetical protein ACFJIV_26805 [Mucilaginibacter sp. UC70_90]
MKKLTFLTLFALLSKFGFAQNLNSMQWYSKPQKSLIEGSTLHMTVDPQPTTGG